MYLCTAKYAQKLWTSLLSVGARVNRHSNDRDQKFILIFLSESERAERPLWVDRETQFLTVTTGFFSSSSASSSFFLFFSFFFFFFFFKFFEEIDYFVGGTVLIMLLTQKSAFCRNVIVVFDSPTFVP